MQHHPLTRSLVPPPQPIFRPKHLSRHTAPNPHAPSSMLLPNEHTVAVPPSPHHHNKRGRILMATISPLGMYSRRHRRRLSSAAIAAAF